ncbi:enoyl-CoA hydratase-related protein [Brevundimonas vancanneytii]|uniref:Probable enoyl-CoA hydratase echA8 n=1 Tax=Brevundimonas vancanneytii TaxID=1325724 RepID=A0A4P1K9S2_9CAUL|nr:enoyl-CoA hydratase-related protein [Brevundimonas vancanneytii]VTO17125.1 Probable enoyl-CoA hydratase echA8 [Brevundimonas vancanneytii]
METLQTLIVEREAGYLVVRIHRPEALNALNNQVMDELTAVFSAAEAAPEVHAVVLTGSDKAFAAGADIKEMASKTYAEAFREDFVTRNWEAAARFRKPIIAAVAGFCLGGGCELAMMCDIIIAAETAKFGQPEINLAVTPGGGGTQRLTRAIGKAKAMDMVLTGRMIGAVEAERAGLVARITPLDTYLAEAKRIAEQIARQSPLAVMMNKEMVDAAFETTLAQGVLFERRLFHSLFAFDDQTEGMAAFIEKRAPNFVGR